MLRATIGTWDVSLLSLKITGKQNEIGTIEFSVPAILIPDRSLIQYSDVVVYDDGNHLASGIILEPESLELSTDGIAVINIKADDDLGRLNNIRAVSDAHFQNSYVAIIIQTLLAHTDDWVLTDISTMVDLSAVTTIDLRGKETMFAQLAEVVKAVPQLFLRYGGRNAALGKHELHIGFFGERSNYALQGDNLSALKVNGGAQKNYREVEAIADKSGNSRLSLQAALLYPGITSHPDWANYPIVVSHGKYVIQNLPNPRGGSIVKSFNVIKTRNDVEPTITEIREAGFALWQKGVRFLQATDRTTTLSITALFEDIPRLNDMVYVRMPVYETAYDPADRSATEVKIYDVADWYRITSFSMDGESVVSADRLDPSLRKQLYTVDIEVTDNDYAQTLDDSVDLYDRTERYDSADRTGLISNSDILAVTPVMISHELEPIDCGGDSKEYVFPMPSVPGGATFVYVFVVNSNILGANIYITQYPELPSTPMIACANVAGQWPSAVGPLEITANFIFV